jgi:2,3-dihydroxybenzoate decarboxylase
MKKIAIEEHFVTESFINYLHSRKKYPRRDFIEKGGKKLVRDWWSLKDYMMMDPDVPDKALDVGEGRLQDMNAASIDMQVLSFVHPNTGRFSASEGTMMARKINDELAETVQKNPERLAGLANFAPQDPDAAARELERAVKDLGMKGAAIAGHVGEEYLDNQKYWVILEMAEKLDVPIYFHPGPPSEDMIKPYLAYPALALGLWGFAAEAGLHAMRLICSGVFDKYPGLKIILGHLGESLPFWLWRLDSRWPTGKGNIPIGGMAYKDFKKLPSQYFRDNFYVTTSGMFWPPVIQFVSSVLGADRVLFATDYPYETTIEAVKALEATPIKDEDKEKICHLNAERLFKL